MPHYNYYILRFPSFYKFQYKARQLPTNHPHAHLYSQYKLAQLDANSQELYWEAVSEVSRGVFEDAVSDIVAADPKLKGVVLRPEDWETDTDGEGGNEPDEPEGGAKVEEDAAASAELREALAKAQKESVASLAKVKAEAAKEKAQFEEVCEGSIPPTPPTAQQQRATRYA